MTELTTALIETAGLGHDGACDYDGGCDQSAAYAMLSAVQPDGWSTRAPAASLAFVCAAHLACEPRAALEDAESCSSYIGPDARPIWDLLLARYPEPVRYRK